MFASRRLRRTPAQKLRDLAWGLWLTPPILLSPFVVLPFLMDFRSAVTSIADAWQIYLLFFVLPWLGGAAAWRQGRRLDRADQQQQGEERKAA